jgi:hypothetical protein
VILSLGHLIPLALHHFTSSGYIKDALYVLSLPYILPKLDGKTQAAATTVTPTMVRSVWTVHFKVYDTGTESHILTK